MSNDKNKQNVDVGNPDTKTLAQEDAHGTPTSENPQLSSDSSVMKVWETRGLAHNDIVNPSFTFEFYIPTTMIEFGSVVFHLMKGTRELDQFYVYAKYGTWVTASLNTDELGAVLLIGKRAQGGGQIEELNYRLWLSQLPIIESDNVTGEVTGAGGGSAVLHIVMNNTDYEISGAFSATNNRWTSALKPDVKSGRHAITIRQSFTGYTRRWAQYREITYLAAPLINTPARNEIVTSDSEGRILVSGTNAAPGYSIQVTNEHGVVYGHSAPAEDSGAWVCRLTPPNFGICSITARHPQSGDAAWAEIRTFEVHTRTPAITTPAQGSVQGTTFTLTGNNGVAGATVEVIIDTDETVVGRTSVTGDTWSCVVNVPVGPTGLVAIQKKDAFESKRGISRAFKIRPPAITAVNVTYPTETNVKFSGSGHTGAMLDISIVSGPGGAAPPAVPVTGGTWETIATNWPFGTYSLKAIQKVSDKAGGWIESEPYTFPFSRVFPKPQKMKSTEEYQPTFSGEGLNGATVQLALEGDSDLIALQVRVVEGLWSSKALAVWGPKLNEKCRARQGLTTQWSEWENFSVTIPPLAPGVNEPVENGLSPQLSGTCWPGAEIILMFSDIPTVHTVPSNNGNWTFRRDTPFVPEVSHKAVVRQKFVGLFSPEASKTFMVYRPIPQPVITEPEAGAEVGRDMTVKGTDGMAGATMQLRDAVYQSDLGQPKTLTSDGEWSIDLPGLAFRQYTIDAQQKRHPKESLRSAHRIFQVVLLPPFITVPLENGDLPRTSTLEGWAMPNARVEVRLEGVAEPVLKDIPVEICGRWKAEVTLPVGAKIIWARQTFDKQTSQDSQPMSYNVVPAAPFIETPATGEHIGRRVVVSGFGVPGDTVAVRLGNTTRTVLARGPVLVDRTWSVAVELDRPGGLVDLVAVASCDGFDSADSPGRAVVLGTYLPSIEVPATGRWVSNPVRFEGQGRLGSGQVTNWFNPEQVWLPNIPVTQDGWQGGATQLLPGGGQWCRFKQTLTDGTDGATVSDWVDGHRFEILPAPSTEP